MGSVSSVPRGEGEKYFNLHGILTVQVPWTDGWQTIDDRGWRLWRLPGLKAYLTLYYNKLDQNFVVYF